MYSLKKSLAALAGLSLVLGLIVTFTPTQGQGQAGSKPPTDVRVINTPLPVRDVDNPARQPFQANFRIPFSSPSDGKIAVPADKHLVIEFASVDVGVDSDCRVPAIAIQTIAAGVVAEHFIPTVQFPFTTRNVAIAAQQVRVYADPGTEAFVKYYTSGVDCNHSGVISVSGHYVDVLQQ